MVRVHRSGVPRHGRNIADEAPSRVPSKPRLTVEALGPPSATLNAQVQLCEFGPLSVGIRILRLLLLNVDSLTASVV
jgi:hypothetical protein